MKGFEKREKNVVGVVYGCCGIYTLDFWARAVEGIFGILEW